MTMERMAKAVGLFRRSIAEHFKRMVAAGLLVREGGRAHGVWKVEPHDQHKEDD